MSRSFSPSGGPLEFNFEQPKQPAHHGNGAAKKAGETPLERDPTAVVFKGPSRPEKYEETPKEHESMNIGIPINARKSMDRQKREQQVFSTVLGSAATLLLLLILSLGALAGLGGYVLWKQIHQQSLTVSLLEQNLRSEIDQLKKQTEETEQQLAAKQEASGKDILRLQAHSEEQRAIITELSRLMNSQKEQSKTQAAQLERLQRAYQEQSKRLDERLRR
ncbi:MAG: hypothetical protein V1746_05380 [bacterium]